MTRYRYAPLPDSSIRLLRLLAGPHLAAPLRCELIHTPLSSAPRYEALSYNWGSTSNPSPIISLSPGPYSFPATRNLDLALRHLRHKTDNRLLWVDAICINQSDPIEQAAQVRIMWDIYARARRVLVWLGPETGDSAIAMDNIAKRDCEAKEKARHIFREKFKGPCGCHAGNFDNHASRVGVMDLLKAPWFTRAWVLQEVAAAGEVAVICGDRVVDGQDFHDEMTSLSVASLAPTLGMQISQRKQVVNLMDKKGKAVMGGMRVPLLELMERFKGWESTKMVDKLFAVLAFSEDANRVRGLQPDYTIDAGVLARRIVAFVLPGCEIEDGDGTEVKFKVQGLLLGDVKDAGGVIGGAKHYTFQSGESKAPGAIWNPKVLEIFNGEDRKNKWGIVLDGERKLNGSSAAVLLRGASRPAVVRLHEGEAVVEMLATPEPTKGDFRWINNKPKNAASREQAWPGVHRSLLTETEGWIEFELAWDPFSPPHPSTVEHYKLRLNDPDLQWDAYMESLRDQYDNGEIDEDTHNCHTITAQFAVHNVCVAAIGSLSQELTMTLHKAAWSGFARTARLLLDADVDINELVPGLGTPLHLAARRGHAKVVKVLLDAGADFTITDGDGKPALLLAILCGNYEVGEMLIAAGAVLPTFDSTPLDRQFLQYAMSGNLAGMKDMLALGIDPNNAEAGGTALHCAAEMGRSEIIAALLEASAHVDLRLGANGKTPLHLAAMNGHEKAAKALLAAGADVNALSARGTTPLDEGLSRGKLGVSKLVCEAGGELASALLGKE